MSIDTHLHGHLRGHIVRHAGPPSGGGGGGGSFDALLLETGDYLLLETGSRILLDYDEEEIDPEPPPES